MWNLILNQNTSSQVQLTVPLFPPPPPPPPPPPRSESNLESKISPSILLIIVILAVIFFISGLLHLLVRYLLRPTNRQTEELDNVTALQGQLQQLFQLHDSGVDQSYIDNLPVFLYRAIIGLKDPFDCAVCLCEFEPDDKLRLLPKCSHAFHIECIDTWLLSHSTCPLCRSSLLPDFSPNGSSCSPVVLVLESGSESFRDIAPAAAAAASHDSFQDLDLGPSITNTSAKRSETGSKEDAAVDVSDTKVVQVKLGKFRNVDATVVDSGEGSSSGGGGGGNNNLDQRRCFSMGSYEYVMNEASVLQVAIKPSKKKPGRSKKPGGSRLAVSECDFHSTREPFRGLTLAKGEDGGGSARIGTSSKRDSFSISKIWLRNKKDKAVSEHGSRRAFSFRLPLHRELPASAKSSVVSPRTTMSEIEDCGGSVVDFDLEMGSCNNSTVSMESQIEHVPSFARRTLLWIAGRQNKVGTHL